MKRLIFVCLLFCASLAFAQADGPGGPTGSGTPSKCGRPNCTVSGTLTVGPGTPNEGTVGTDLNKTAKFVNTGGVVQLKKCTTTDTLCYLVVKESTGAATGNITGNAWVQGAFTQAMTFSNTAVVNDWVAASTTSTDGQVMDTGVANTSPCPTPYTCIGYAMTAGTGSQTVVVTSPIVGGKPPSISFNIVKSGAIGVFPTYIGPPCTIYRVDVTADQSGTIALDIWKAAGAIPAAGGKISGTTWTPLSSAQSSFNTSLSGWTNSGAVAVSSGDVFGGTVGTFTTVTNVLVQIWCH